MRKEFQGALGMVEHCLTIISPAQQVGAQDVDFSPHGVRNFRRHLPAVEQRFNPGQCG